MSPPPEDRYRYRSSGGRNLVRYRAYYRFAPVIIESPPPLQTLSFHDRVSPSIRYEFGLRNEIVRHYRPCHSLPFHEFGLRNEVVRHTLSSFYQRRHNPLYIIINSHSNISIVIVVSIVMCIVNSVA